MFKTNSAISKQFGFTLLEVLVAVAIIGTALVMLLGSVNGNLVIASKVRDVQIASNLAQKILTEIDLEGYPEVRDESGEFEEAPGFEWYLTVLPYDITQIDTELRIVRVLITWDEGNEDFEIWTAISED